jgi:hypothetical protein
METGVCLLRDFILNMLRVALTTRTDGRTDRVTPGDIDLIQNVHNPSFNLHVKLHGNFITVNLSAVSVLHSLPVILLGLHDHVFYIYKKSFWQKYVT